MMKRRLSIAFIALCMPFSDAHTDEEPMLASDTLFPSESSEGEKMCEAIGTPEQKYIYGEAELKYFSEHYPPAGTRNKHDNPRSYGASFISPSNGQVDIYIRGSWKDSSVPESELELAPLPIPMIIGKRYGFCYQQRRGKFGTKAYTFIDYPETIQLIEE